MYLYNNRFLSCTFFNKPYHDPGDKFYHSPALKKLIHVCLFARNGTFKPKLCHAIGGTKCIPSCVRIRPNHASCICGQRSHITVNQPTNRFLPRIKTPATRWASVCRLPTVMVAAVICIKMQIIIYIAGCIKCIRDGIWADFRIHNPIRLAAAAKISVKC